MNMQSHHKVCIVHGYTANCDAQWFPWMKAQLETQGVSVVVPICQIPIIRIYQHGLNSWKIVYRIWTKTPY